MESFEMKFRLLQIYEALTPLRSCFTKNAFSNEEQIPNISKRFVLKVPVPVFIRFFSSSLGKVLFVFVRKIM